MKRAHQSVKHSPNPGASPDEVPSKKTPHKHGKKPVCSVDLEIERLRLENDRLRALLEEQEYALRGLHREEDVSRYAIQTAVKLAETVDQTAKSLRDTIEALVDCFVEACRQKDKDVSGHNVNDLGGHVERVQIYTTALATAYVKSYAQFNKRRDLTEEEAYALGLASKLHDIGKLRVPDTILNKPDRFTENDREEMRKHTLAGFDILSAMEHKLQDRNLPIIRFARQICKTHHENWDGSGYPDGLKGKEIPLAGRIVRIADAYDALTSERVYKGAYARQAALAELSENSWKLFDPILVDMFTKIPQVRFVEISQEILR